MAQLIDPSRITVVKDSDNRAQDILNKLFSENENDYYYSTSASLNTTKKVYIYFKTDKPVYLSRIDIRGTSTINNPSSCYLYAYENETFSGSRTVLTNFSRGTVTEYTSHLIDKTKIKKYQYFCLYVYDGKHSTSKDWYMSYQFKAKLYGEDSMPKYIMKNVDGDYFYTQDNSIVTVRKEDITEDILMDDVNTVTKENLELVKDKFKVLRILVP